MRQSHRRLLYQKKYNKTQNDVNKPLQLLELEGPVSGEGETLVRLFSHVAHFHRPAGELEAVHLLQRLLGVLGLPVGDEAVALGTAGFLEMKEATSKHRNNMPAAFYVLFLFINNQTSDPLFLLRLSHDRSLGNQVGSTVQLLITLSVT